MLSKCDVLITVIEVIIVHNSIPKPLNKNMLVEDQTVVVVAQVRRVDAVAGRLAAWWQEGKPSPVLAT